MAWQHRLQETVLSASFTGSHAFLTPPFFAWIFVPLAALPYGWGFAAWSVIGVVFLALTLWLLGTDRLVWATGVGLAFFPAFASITFGQNGLLSLLILTLTWWLWFRDRQAAAGFCASVLLYKPHLLIGVVFLWLLHPRRERGTLLGFGTGALFLLVICVSLTPEATRAFLELSAGELPGLLHREGFPISHAHSLRAFWALLVGRGEVLAEGAWLLSSAGCIVTFVWLDRRRPEDRRLLFAGAVVLTLLIAPHVMVYDWAVLILPFALLVDRIPEGRWGRAAALIWGTTLVAGQLTRMQLELLSGRAVQFTVPALVLALMIAWRGLPTYRPA